MCLQIPGATLPSSLYLWDLSTELHIILLVPTVSWWILDFWKVYLPIFIGITTKI